MALKFTEKLKGIEIPKVSASGLFGKKKQEEPMETLDTESPQEEVQEVQAEQVEKAEKMAVDLGRTYKVQIEPSEGWRVHSVTFDGVDMTAQLDENGTFTTPTLNGSAVLNVAYEQMEGNKVASVRNDAIKVRGYQDRLFISGTESGDHIAIYTASGAVAAEVKAEGTESEISVESGQLYIVKAAGKVVKIQM